MDEHECCPCVERLRRQNKESSDAWTRRTAELQSRHDGMTQLLVEARGAVRQLTTPGNVVLRGTSVYVQAIVAAALDEADQAQLDLAAARSALADERRVRRYAQAQLDDRIRADERRRKREEGSPR